MEIDNAVESFFRFYESESFDLNVYHQRHSRIFDTYFNGWCKKTDEKLATALERYSDDYPRLKEVTRLLPGVIEKIEAKEEDYFDFALDVPVHLFVGLYASNAFVDHQAEIYFAIEKLVPDPELLEVIVAHEMIHSYHYQILGHAGIDWGGVDWVDARVSMYLEGIASYFSEKMVPGLSRNVYFSYEEDDGDWLSFCENHHSEIAAAFLHDLKNGATDLNREWFRLSGGRRFGYNRLGYFLGTGFVRNLCDRFEESEVLALLAKGNVQKEADCWLQAQVEN